MQLSGKILFVSSKTLADVRDTILTYHIMVEYCSYFTLWGLGLPAMYYIKEVQGSVLYYTDSDLRHGGGLGVMDGDIIILYSNTS